MRKVVHSQHFSCPANDTSLKLTAAFQLTGNPELGYARPSDRDWDCSVLHAHGSSGGIMSGKGRLSHPGDGRTLRLGLSARWPLRYGGRYLYPQGRSF
jgi:hypothetical protein